MVSLRGVALAALVGCAAIASTSAANAWGWGPFGNGGGWGPFSNNGNGWGNGDGGFNMNFTGRGNGNGWGNGYRRGPYGYGGAPYGYGGAPYGYGGAPYGYGPPNGGYGGPAYAPLRGRWCTLRRKASPQRTATTVVFAADCHEARPDVITTGCVCARA